MRRLWADGEGSRRYMPRTSRESRGRNPPHALSSLEGASAARPLRELPA